MTAIVMPSMTLIERRVRERGWTLEEACFTPVGKERRPRPRERKVLKNLVRRKFGKLVVKRFWGRDAKHRAFWICRCSCGVEIRVQHSNLLSHRTRSCGHERPCLVSRRRNLSQRNEAA